MRSTFQVSDVRCYQVLPADRILGLRCFASCRVGAWQFDGLAVRRSMGGHYFVKWPSHVDGNGVEHLIAQPADEEIRGLLRRAVNAAVLAKAREGGWIE